MKKRWYNQDEGKGMKIMRHETDYLSVVLSTIAIIISLVNIAIHFLDPLPVKKTGYSRDPVIQEIVQQEK